MPDRLIPGPEGKPGARGKTGQPGLPLSRGAAYLFIVTFVSMFALIGADVQYSTWRAARADQRWCAVIVSIDDTLTKTPPDTDSGRAYAANMHRLRHDLGCK